MNPIKILIKEWCKSMLIGTSAELWPLMFILWAMGTGNIKDV